MARHLLLALFSFIYLGISAQTAVPKEKKGFVGWVESRISISSPEKAKVFKEEFEDYWKGCQADQEKFAYDLAEAIMKKKGKGYPHLFQGLLALRYFHSGETPKAPYQSWKDNILEYTKSNSPKKAEPVYELIYHLAKEGGMYMDVKYSWFVDSGKLSFEKQGSNWGVQIDGANLKGFNQKKDTLIVSQLSGFYSPKSRVLKGTEGVLSWRRVGLNPGKNFAQLNDFELKTSTSVLRSDSAFFTSEFYPEPLAGELADKLVTSENLRNATFPKFNSFDKNLVIEAIVENVNYRGGMAVEGAKLLASGSLKNPAGLEFIKDGEPYLITRGLRFSITPDLIAGEQVEVTIRLRQDSIFHPSLTFQYNLNNQQVTMLQVNQQASQTPYFNSYQMVDMYAEKIWMQHGGDSLYFGAIDGSSVPRVSFESGDFYSDRRYNSLMLSGQQSPLNVFADIADRGGWKFDIKTVQRAFGCTEGEAVKLTYSLAQKGFIYLNETTREIEAKQKLFDYISAAAKKKDYDVIRFESKTRSPLKPNAVMDLDSFRIDVVGLSKVTLSDSQNVQIRPDGRELVLLKNRNFKFNGKVRAGKLDFYGSEFLFKYDEFKIDMELIDSCRMFVENTDPDKNGPGKFIRVKSQLENLSGELVVDAPNNKSGLWSKDNPQYPVFTSERESYVYYDKIPDHPGVYPKEGFYFELQPFEIDSLDNFDPNNLAMGGKLKSGGIFPDIQNELTIQEDFSLGFEHATPPEGLPMYGGMATFKNDLKLWNDGLQGDGDLEYLTSTSYSKEFTFFPDSTKGTANFHNEGEGPANVAFADCKISDLKYYPTQNTMNLRNIAGAFEMYKGEALHRGQVQLQPQGMYGNGDLTMYDGKVESPGFQFMYEVSKADTANFELTNVANNEIAIRNEKVSAEVNFTTRKGTFKAIDVTDSKIEFPSTQYIAYMDYYDWLVDDKKIEFKSTMSAEVTDSTSSNRSRFYSVHPNQDSLNFKVKSAIYDISTYDINAKGVKQINIADAYVVPAGGDVDIHVGAVMEPLEKAEIIADRINEYHRIFDAHVEVAGAEGFKASGMYNYVDENNTKTPIPFQNIRVENGTTVADGEISEEEGFQLSAAFAYRGGVNLVAPLKGLRFNGATKLLLAEEEVSNSWLVFDGQVDPKNVTIPVAPGMKSDEGVDMHAGIVISREDMTPYRAFIRPLKSPEDLVMMMPTGILSYNKAKNQYEINPALDKEEPGAEKYEDVLSYNLGSGVVNQYGETFFGMNFGQMDVRGFGKAKLDPKSPKVSFKGSVKVDMFFPDDPRKFIMDQLESYPFLQPFSLLNTEYQSAIGRWDGVKAAEKVFSDISEKGVMNKVPAEVKESLVIADIRLNWDETNERFLSDGKVGLAHFKDRISSTYVNGLLAFSSLRSGDEFYFFMEPDPTDWYFFKYKIGRMGVVGKKVEYNALFSELKPKDLEMKTKKNETPFQVVLTTGSKKKQFLESLAEQ